MCSISLAYVDEQCAKSLCSWLYLLRAPRMPGASSNASFRTETDILTQNGQENYLFLHHRLFSPEPKRWCTTKPLPVFIAFLEVSPTVFKLQPVFEQILRHFVQIGFRGVVIFFWSLNVAFLQLTLAHEDAFWYHHSWKKLELGYCLHDCSKVSRHTTTLQYLPFNSQTGMM